MYMLFPFVFSSPSIFTLLWLSFDDLEIYVVPLRIYASLPGFPQENTRKAISSKRGVTCPKTTRQDAIRC